MMLIAGIDIGNCTTEAALAIVERTGEPRFLASAITDTTGIKGTVDNVPGVMECLSMVMAGTGKGISDLELILLNDATPVIGDVAMETISETIITESTMIGHNPATPGGIGLGVGKTLLLGRLDEAYAGEQVIVVVPGHIDFSQASDQINAAFQRGVAIQAAIVQKDEAVLIANRIQRTIPIVDEVSLVDRVPLGMLAAVEVADPGRSISTLSNPYGIATVFGLTPEETKNIAPIARALIGNRSAVVIKTPAGDVRERRIPAGSLTLIGERATLEIDLQAGAQAILQAIERTGRLRDAKGEPGTNVGGMLERVRSMMSHLTDQPMEAIRIQDLLPVDTLVQQAVVGGLAGELSSENAVALAAMVASSRLSMGRIADQLAKETGAQVQVGGVEAHMALHGALTTPGADLPLAILDLGAGSTDAALAGKDGQINVVHLAGAGDMVNLIIDAELALDDRNLAEEIKRFPVGRVDNLFLLRGEDGTVRFFEEPLDPKLFARTVVIKDEGLAALPGDLSIEKVRAVRRKAKNRVFVTNTLRALNAVAPAGNLRLLSYVVLVGGCALDFEIPGMISDALAEYGVVVGTANVRSSEGPRNAVATGLVLSYANSTPLGVSPGVLPLPQAGEGRG